MKSQLSPVLRSVARERDRDHAHDGMGITSVAACILAVVLVVDSNRAPGHTPVNGLRKAGFLGSAGSSSENVDLDALWRYARRQRHVIVKTLRLLEPDSLD